ncbi:MAG: YajQ family cyclic di-GMP-binding protein [Candidatus Schekmanbacteria bacterium]|nr:MAG: YajQ family cyclic di-GMP-binding protein [Candidatus Schekmanbacteria bacterium]
MPSFDIVSRIDLQEVDNAVNMTKKELLNRYDFRGIKTIIEFDKKEKEIRLGTSDKMKAEAIADTLRMKASKRGIDLKAFSFGPIQEGLGGNVKQVIKIKEGIDKDSAKKIVKMIKDTKLKVQAQIQDNQVRVSGKKIDDLQEIIRLIKNANLDMALQYVNLKR